jgi:acetyltransferase
VEELFDLAMAFAGLSIPRGNRVAIVTNAGGPGVIIADACAAEGLEVAELRPETVTGLTKIFRTELQIANPLHLDGTTTADDYRTALDLVLADPGVDAAIAAFVPPLGAKQQNVAQSIVQAARAHPQTPILAVLMGRDGLPEGRAGLKSAGVPAYIFPESAVRALAALCRHGKWLQRPVQAATTFPVDSERVAELIGKVLASGRTELMENEAYAILDAYGIPTIPHRVAVSREEAVAAAEEIGYPVVLKALSPKIVRRSEVGSVLVDLRDPEEVSSGYDRLVANLEKSHPDLDIAGFLVAPYLSEGRELIVGMTTDPTFGPVLMFGLGGIYVETFKDVAFRICPVTEREALEMIESIRGFPLLAGARGGEPVRIESVVEVLQRLSQLVQEHTEIREIDVNPLRGAADGVMAMDAWIGIEGSATQN